MPSMCIEAALECVVHIPIDTTFGPLSPPKVHNPQNEKFELEMRHTFTLKFSFKRTTEVNFNKTLASVRLTGRSIEPKTSMELHS